MRFLPVFLLSYASASSQDPCRQLCLRDGPSVCSGGSWTKSGAVCHGYFFRDNPALNDYCYHTSASGSTCPATGAPVRVVDAVRLLDVFSLAGFGDDEDDLAVAAPEAGTTTVAPTTNPSFRPQLASALPQTSGAMPFNMMMDLIMGFGSEVDDESSDFIQGMFGSPPPHNAFPDGGIPPNQPLPARRSFPFGRVEFLGPPSAHGHGLPSAGQPTHAHGHPSAHSGHPAGQPTHGQGFPSSFFGLPAQPPTHGQGFPQGPFRRSGVPPMPGPPVRAASNMPGPFPQGIPVLAASDLGAMFGPHGPGQGEFIISAPPGVDVASLLNALMGQGMMRPDPARALAGIVASHPTEPSQTQHRILVSAIADVAAAARRPALDVWRNASGEALLALASRSTAAVLPALMLGVSLNVEPGAEAAFAAASGLATFCAEHAVAIREQVALELRGFDQRIARVIDGGMSEVRRYSVINLVAADLPLYCPSLLNTPLLRSVALAHRLVRDAVTSASHRDGGLRLSVNRTRAFEESVSPLNGRANDVRAGVVAVTFTEELAAGQGVVREWFTEVAADLVESGILRLEEHVTVLNEASAMGDRRAAFRAAGRFLAASLMHQQPIGIRLSRTFLARLLDQQLELEDIHQDDPAMHSSLQYILADERTDEDLETIEIAGQIVTLANRVELVRRKLNSLQERSPQFDAIRDAFNDVVSIESIRAIVSAADLQAILFGNPDVTVADIRANVELGGYVESDPQMEWLWNTLGSYDARMRRAFIRFVTGSDQVPVGGLSSLPRRLLIDASGTASSLPSSNTCVYNLHLPRYATEAELREKLTIALRADSGMGFL